MFEIFENFAQQNEEADTQREDGAFSQNSQVPFGAPVFVVSAGGSLFFCEKPITPKIAKFCETINRLHSEGFRFVIVSGGGRIARNYAGALKSFGANNFDQDQLGIAVTRINARLFVEALDQSCDEVLTHPKEALEVLEKGKIPVIGGLFPFFTTDAVAALICEVVGGTFVNLTDVDGVFNADPKKNQNARLFKSLSYEKLLSLLKLAGSKPGQNLVMDLPSCLILQRSKIKGIVLNGDELENFEAMVRGQDFTGTVIADDPEKSGIEGEVEEVE